MKYTVKNATPSGEQSQYGIEYLVNFNEDDRTVRISRKFPIKDGAEFIGEIIDNPKYGAYFKSAPKQEGSSQPQLRSTQKPKKNENSFYVAYAKDLMVAYLNSINWDWSKYDEASFNNSISAVSQGAKDLMESLEKPEITIEEIKDSWMDGIA